MIGQNIYHTHTRMRQIDDRFCQTQVGLNTHTQAHTHIPVCTCMSIYIVKILEFLFFKNTETL